MRKLDISFTGINNLYIGKKTYSKVGSYLSNDSKLKQGNKNYTLIKISADLTDDQNGSDLTDFKTALSKCRPCYQINCINKEQPNKIELLVKRSDIQDDIGKSSHSIFSINNYEIMLDEKQILPLFTYMAKLTRKIAKLQTTSENQKYYANLANKYIDTEARNFIETY